MFFTNRRQGVNSHVKVYLIAKGAFSGFENFSGYIRGERKMSCAYFVRHVYSASVNNSYIYLNVFMQKRSFQETKKSLNL